MNETLLYNKGSFRKSRLCFRLKAQLLCWGLENQSQECNKGLG